MNIYPLDYVIERTLENRLSREQWLLKQISGKRFDREEALVTWARILDHKWHISEQLGRDVGLKVAVTDFFENIYDSTAKRTPRQNSGRFSFGSTQSASIMP